MIGTCPAVHHEWWLDEPDDDGLDPDEIEYPDFPLPPEDGERGLAHDKWWLTEAGNRAARRHAPRLKAPGCSLTRGGVVGRRYAFAGGALCDASVNSSNWPPTR